MYLEKMKDSSFLIVFIILAIIDAFILMVFVNYALVWLLGVRFSISFGKAMLVVLFLHIMCIMRKFGFLIKLLFHLMVK